MYHLSKNWPPRAAAEQFSDTQLLTVFESDLLTARLGLLEQPEVSASDENNGW